MRLLAVLVANFSVQIISKSVCSDLILGTKYTICKNLLGVCEIFVDQFNYIGTVLTYDRNRTAGTDS